MSDKSRADIRLLPDHVINRIAAGEVVDRPSGAIKELIENAIDAGATRIDITILGGGKTCFIVEDNGHGIKKSDLALCLQRHTTSKIYDDANGEADLVHLQHFGFRGEALASLSSISDLTLTSHHHLSDVAYQVTSHAGALTDVKPSSFPVGTRIEVRDIFHSVPARLKFSKSERSEQAAITDMLKRVAMAHPDVHFTLKDHKRIILQLAAAPGDLFDKKCRRIADILGQDFIENAMPIDVTKENVTLEGMTSLPTYHRGNGLQQYLFVNGRAVRDKMLNGILRAAYAEHMARDRHPVCALFISLPYEDVDVNVHPTKAEVRFKNNDHIRGLMITAIRDAIAQIGHRASNHTTQKALESFAEEPRDTGHADHDITVGTASPPPPPPPSEDNSDKVQSFLPLSRPGFKKSSLHAQSPVAIHQKESASVSRLNKASHPYKGNAVSQAETEAPSPIVSSSENKVSDDTKIEIDIPPLGYAKGQVHETYIIAQTEDDMIIVDQHAAHERIVLEKVKEGLKKGGLQAQNLLLPEIVTLDESLTENVAQNIEALEKYGLILERFGVNQILVRAVPNFLISSDVKQLVKDIADDLKDERGPDSLTERINLICATFACHHSVRAGRKLNIEEMNHLLRDMESTEGAGQCNHGRPTYITLAKNDIERLFGRK
ncbi:MAG: DNA mismatch repair endonuclease MutL [Pseudomonadota bacterium]